MSKKKNKKVVQMLSPENYIRQRSRALPIHKCWIMKGWQELGKTSVIVSRKHANGNISFCFYLVDLFCLGVKDTFFEFNTDEQKLVERIKRNTEYENFEEISYELAHNIIFSAIEFAEEYGFQPHKDFTRTTEFFLEEDDDKIVLINIECGKNGKPFYINDGEDTATTKRILNQLHKTAGEGNYEYLLDDFDDNKNEPEFDKEIENAKYVTDAFLSLSPEIQKQVFDKEPESVYQMILGNEKKDDFDYESHIKLINYLVLFYTHNKEIDSHLKLFEDLFSEITINDDFFGEMIENKDRQTSLFSSDIKEKISELDNIYFDADLYITEKYIDEIIRQFPDFPVFYYYKYQMIDIKNNNDEEINKYLEKFPEFTLLKMSQDRLNILNNLKDQSISDIFSTYFHLRKLINSTEIYELFLNYIFNLSIHTDLEGIIATEIFLQKIQFNNKKQFPLFLLISQIKERFLKEMMNNTDLS